MRSNFKKYYITTPIYYVNAKPHIGHAYTTVVADVLARYYRSQKNKVFFLTGTDEHGAKNARVAEENNQSPQEFVTRQARLFANAWRVLNISNDFFIRTTNPSHKKIVIEFVEKLYQKGDIYRGTYVGRYCVACEEYKTPTEILEGQLCPIHKTKTERLEEEVYFFRLSKYQNQVKKAIKSKQIEIFPRERENEVLSFINLGLDDIALSRPTVKWGIELPWDKKHTLYVWIDALLNYLSAPKIAGVNAFPPDVQIIGKDILRFHTIIWPALLIAAGLDLPKRIAVHGFFTIGGEKMSKTHGNVVDPVEVSKKWGNDALRYYLLRDLTFGEDGDFSWQRFKQRYESELSNALGNLVQRVLAMIKRYDIKIDKMGIKTIESVDVRIKSYDFSGALDVIWNEIAKANAKIEKEKPWLLSEAGKSAELSKLLNGLHSSIGSIGNALAPLLPETSKEILSQLDSLTPTPIFPRINTGCHSELVSESCEADK